MKTVSLEALESAAAAVRNMAIPTDAMKKHCATAMGRDFVARSAASALAVCWVIMGRINSLGHSSELWTIRNERGSSDPNTYSICCAWSSTPHSAYESVIIAKAFHPRFIVSSP